MVSRYRKFCRSIATFGRRPKSSLTSRSLGQGRANTTGSSGFKPSLEILEDRLAPAGGVWNAVDDMIGPRDDAAAVLLNDGQVLVVGGSNGATAELYDSTTDNWNATSNLTSPRDESTATLLNTGQVLVAGGFDGTNYLTSAELYDPTTNKWTATGSMHAAREEATATLLNNGQVLVAGGFNTTSGELVSAELYDPTTGAWTSVGNLNSAHLDDTATLLENGEVLVAGGRAGNTFQSSAELYDPATKSWSVAGSLNNAREEATATLLNNGEVLVAAGYNGNEYLSSAELYNPATNKWTVTGSLNDVRSNATATLLNNGQVLVAGGSRIVVANGLNNFDYLSSAELFNPDTNTWTSTGSLNLARENDSATLLNNGEVLVAGGDNNTSGSNVSSSAELYTPPPAALNWIGSADPAGDVWSNVDAWSPARVPANGDTLEFDTSAAGFVDDAASFTSVNDLSGLSGMTVVINDASAVGDFTLAGNGIGLVGGLGSTISDGGGTTISLPIVLDHSQTFTINDSTTLSGAITGSGAEGVTKIGAASFVLSEPQFAGGMTINGGILQLGDGVAPLTSLTSSGIVDNGTLILANPSGTTLAYANPITGTGSLDDDGRRHA